MSDETTARPFHALKSSPVLRFVDAHTSFAVEEIRISPLEAVYILKHRNPHNRPIREIHLNKLHRDMRTPGAWLFNGDTLRFDREGNLLDGQHRMMAMGMLTNFPPDFALEFLVVAGLPPETQATMDQGARRSFGDMLSMEGTKNAMALAAVARKAFMWDNGDHRFSGKVRPTVRELQDYIDLHPETHRATEVAVRTRTALKGMPPSVVGVAHLVFTRSNKEQAPWFFERLTDGSMLAKGHPVHTLRERLLKIRGDRSERLEADEYMALMIRGWNAYLRNETLEKIIGIHKGVMPSVD